MAWVAGEADTDADGDTLKVTNLTAPTNGTVVLNSDGTVTYKPKTGFTVPVREWLHAPSTSSRGLRG